ncbi:RHH-type rel operon transcriptional repressor/antitoxin RelB [Mesorhizobium robiniae]|uniref:RHH-type rel operon transcriptional repressor/antitoxin RelB n=1 Tax=Mesorhizobium robiniae TaxID=559315 RepID=A0ABV2GYF1_9HYPH
MPTSVRLAPEIEERLDFLAARTGRSKAYYLRELIERGLEDVEDYYLAAEVLERIRSGEEEVVKSEDFWRGLDA